MLSLKMMLLLMLSLQKKKNKFFLRRFLHFRARWNENRINTGRSINHDQVEIISLKIGVFLDIADTCTVAK